MNTIDFKHPECLMNEVFLKNMSEENFKELNFSTKRIGKQSYDGKGNKLESKNWYPTFVTKNELKAKSLILSEIRNELIS